MSGFGYPGNIIPLYLVAGFLDSGKTTLIHSMLRDEGFSRGQKTLLVVCEEGEAEYDEAALAAQGVTLRAIDSADALHPALLVDFNRQYAPQRVIMEYNSVFTLDRLNTLRMPARWELVQLIASVDAGTFESYLANMRQLMTDPLQKADLILFNRCREGMPISAWRRQMRAMNARANILFEFTDGRTDDGVSDEDLPYDMKAAVITVADDQYGAFYLDALDHPARYEGKTLRLKGQAFAGDGLPPGFYRFGRLAMTCCADDIACLAFPCRGDDRPSPGQWFTLTARAQVVRNKAQGQDMVALTQLSATPATMPRERYVTFT